MPGTRIIASGHYAPGEAVTNEMLGRVMETSDEWVYQRTGIRQRHYCAEGQGVSDLGAEAAKRALAQAGVSADSVDYVIFATMTPDFTFPGSGPLLMDKLGVRGVPALDIRQQCAAFPYALQVADGLLASGAAKRILLVAAEAHAALMPWRDWRWQADPAAQISSEEFERATRHRGYAVIFGDGAGACLLERGEADHGLLQTWLASDGALYDQICLDGVGFRQRPYVSEATLREEAELPRMKGRELFKFAVTRLPKAIRAACEKSGVALEEVDWFLGHQANDRINHAVRDALKLDPAKVPSNIARFGNTSGATIPILYDELARAEKFQPGQLVCFFALGAGLHWGASLMRL